MCSGGEISTCTRFQPTPLLGCSLKCHAVVKASIQCMQSSQWAGCAENAVLYKLKSLRARAQSSSSPDSSSSSSFLAFLSYFFLSPFLFLSSLSQSLFAVSRSRSWKQRSNTSRYHATGLPSMPSLMFCSQLAYAIGIIGERNPRLPLATLANLPSFPWGR
jgi:hypothetical protein